MEKPNCIIVNISEYTISPGPRYCEQGEKSGEDFYHSILNEQFKTAIQSDQLMVVDLDRVDGYASSFLDEAFGNLVYDFGIETVKQRIKIISNEEPDWLVMLSESTFPEWEKRRTNNEKPKVTTLHKAWYRLIESQIESDIWNKPA